MGLCLCLSVKRAVRRQYTRNSKRFSPPRELSHPFHSVYQIQSSTSSSSNPPKSKSAKSPRLRSLGSHRILGTGNSHPSDRANKVRTENVGIVELAGRHGQVLSRYLVACEEGVYVYGTARVCLALLNKSSCALPLHHCYLRFTESRE